MALRWQLQRIMFDPRRQCCWCGSDNFRSVTGYAGERQCLTCGWGGDGEPDVPCMFYKLLNRSLTKPALPFGVADEAS